MIVYGIKSCDSVKKATTWLTKNKIKFEFHDYKAEGISETKLKNWSKQVGWEKLLNKKSTTWRDLTGAEQLKVTNEKAAVAVMKEKTSIIKRPLIETNDQVMVVGFNEEEYKKVFKK
ncbi:MAG TPA: ArsC family reductase [Chryseolinea sp.]|nr:ArsC family reductase [Chryseolinea sp.]